MGCALFTLDLVLFNPINKLFQPSFWRCRFQEPVRQGAPGRFAPLPGCFLGVVSFLFVTLNPPHMWEEFTPLVGGTCNLCYLLGVITPHVLLQPLSALPTLPGASPPRWLAHPASLSAHPARPPTHRSPVRPPALSLARPPACPPIRPPARGPRPGLAFRHAPRCAACSCTSGPL